MRRILGIATIGSPRARHYVFLPLLSAAGLAMLIANLGTAFAQSTAQSITGCVKIDKPGLYDVNSASLSSAAGDCLFITAAKVALNLNGATITGSGNGAGIHLGAAAANAFIEGRGASISGFAEGIEIDSAKAVAENFTTSNNSDAGVWLNNAKSARLTTFTSGLNSTDGVRINKGSYNAIVGAVILSQNGRYGVWLTATNHNSVGGFVATDNALAGVYIGCSNAGPIDATCIPRVAASKFNSIFGGTLDATSAASQLYGVAIDLGDDSNIVSNITSINTNELIDLLDENSNCAHDDWFAQGIIASKSPISCIH